MNRFFLVLLLALAAFRPAHAQEFDCKVSIQHAAIRNTDAQVFRNLEKAIADLMNTRKWTADAFLPEEKIALNIMMNLTEKSGEDVFAGTLNITAARPVFNASYASPTVNFVDRNMRFRYSQFFPLNFDDNRITGNDPLASNLTAILGYNAYLVLGLDYDSFAPNGGEALFKKAQAVVANAPDAAAGPGISGWTASENQRNRYWIIDQLLNPRFRSFRSYWYSMHREGLDNLYQKPELAREKMLAGIPVLAQLQRENPGAILLIFFFAAKSDELARVVAQMPQEARGPYITQLVQADENGVLNTRKYEALR